jgi:uridylate kinase
MLASSSKSELLVFFTDVDGVYTSDPKLDRKAKKFETMTSHELVNLVAGQRVEPGMNIIIDPIGVRLIERARIRTLVLGRHEISRLADILKGAKHSGTTITPG